jgi:hypothetical protein
MTCCRKMKVFYDRSQKSLLQEARARVRVLGLQIMNIVGSGRTDRRVTEWRFEPGADTGHHVHAPITLCA